MSKSEESTKQILILAFQLLMGHVEEIARLRASLGATLEILESRIPDFPTLHALELERLRALDAPYLLRDTQAIEQMLAQIQR